MSMFWSYLDQPILHFVVVRAVYTFLGSVGSKLLQQPFTLFSAEFQATPMPGTRAEGCLHTVNQVMRHVPQVLGQLS